MELCKCGRSHRSDTKHIIIGQDALQKLPDIITESGCKNILLVADVNTYPLAGKKVESLLSQCRVCKYIYNVKYLIPDEDAIGRLLVATNPEDTDESTDMIVALGAGTVNDLCRYVSYRLGIPYIIIATAPSMDGYASNVSPLIVNGLKTTYEATVAYAIIADTNLLSTAPAEMLSAGLGDMVGKYVCLTDWALGKIVMCEYYCDYVADLTRTSVEKCALHANSLTAKTAASIESLTDGLILSGIAMSYIGNSRPASGSEHHISHFWEMMFMFDGRQPVLHGAKVGVSTLVMIKLYELISKSIIDWAEVINNVNYSPAEFRSCMNNIYGPAAAGIILAAEKTERSNIENTVERLRTYQENWQLILDTINNGIPKYDTVKNLLTITNSPISPSEIGVSREEFINAICYAKEIRQRYTVLQMAADIGLLQNYAAELADFFYDGQVTI